MMNLLSAAFREDQSSLLTERDEAPDQSLFEIIIAVANHFRKLYRFHQHIHRSIGSKVEFVEEDEPTGNQVTVSSIHEAKGKEDPNVVWFNLSQNRRSFGNSDSKEERRFAYAGVTRGRDSIFITARKDKPSVFLREAVFNPWCKGISFAGKNAAIASNNQRHRMLRSRVTFREAGKELVYQKFPELNGDPTL